MALFAALSYAITKSSRGTGNIDKEKAKLDAAVAQDCTARVEQAVLRLKITGGCADSEISYELSDGTNANPDAPADKHCHVFDPAGTGETPCGSYLVANTCDSTALEDLSAGQCGVGNIVFVSDGLGYRLYTTIADQGTYNWDDGQTACTGLGDGWHMPTNAELDELYGAKNTGSLNGTFNETDNLPASIYWSYTPDRDDFKGFEYFCGGCQYSGQGFDGGQTNEGAINGVSVRCVR